MRLAVLAIAVAALAVTACGEPIATPADIHRRARVCTVPHARSDGHTQTATYRHPYAPAHGHPYAPAHGHPYAPAHRHADSHR